MDTLWLALRSDLRRNWRTLVSLALLLGLAGGVVLTAAAGARRTDTAYPRLLNWANAAQLDVVPGGLAPAYFAALGVSHLYLSPILAARAGRLTAA